MKYKIGSALLILCLTALCFLQSGAQGNGYNSAQLTTFTVTGSGITLQQNSLILYHEIIWTPTAAGVCTVTVDSSTNGISWTTGGVITTQTCTSQGNSAIVNVQANYIRVTVQTFTGTSVNIQYEGWAYNPGGGGGGGTITGVTAGTGLNGGGTTGTVTLNVTTPANTGTAGQEAYYSGTNAISSDAGVATNDAGTLTLGGAGIGSGALSFKGSTSGTQSFGCGSATCPAIAAGVLQLSGKLGQSVASQFAGKCTMATATTCTFTLGTAFTNYLSFVSVDQASVGALTVANSCGAALSAGTVTITCAVANSLTWDALFIGNPT